MRTFGTSPFGNIPPVTKNLLIINVLMFVAANLVKTLPLSLWLSAYYPGSAHFRIWQPLTYMFMHGGLGHIFFNMFALYSFGTTLEYIMGPKRFLNFYLLTGVGAYFLQAGIQAYEVHQILGTFTLPDVIKEVVPGQSINLPENLRFLTQEQFDMLGAAAISPMVGASGAIMGILVAFGMLLPNAELMLIFLPIPIKAKYFIPIYIVLELFLGVYRIPGDPIAHFAHVGGAVFGFILMKAWNLRKPGGYL